MQVVSFEVGPLMENAYLLVDPVAREAIMVDPGDDGDRLVRAIEGSGASLEAIWLTHAHFDHIGAVGQLRRRFDVPVFLHEDDLALFDAGPMQAAAWGIPFAGDQAPRRRFREGDLVKVGRFSFEVMHTPGHAPGHVTLVGQGIALVGDCLFAGSVGRSDLPLASPADLDRSLARLAALPPETRVLPGHGPETTIGRELRTNPFLQHLAVSQRR